MALPHKGAKLAPIEQKTEIKEMVSDDSYLKNKSKALKTSKHTILNTSATLSLVSTPKQTKNYH